MICYLWVRCNPTEIHHPLEVFDDSIFMPGHHRMVQVVQKCPYRYWERLAVEGGEFWQHWTYSPIVACKYGNHSGQIGYCGCIGSFECKCGLYHFEHMSKNFCWIGDLLIYMKELLENLKGNILLSSLHHVTATCSVL